MKHLLMIIGLFFGFTLQAQMVEELSVPTRRALEPDQWFINLPESDDTINIPFVDDFSYRSNIPNPKLWADRDVYVNNTYGINPPTIGVATFDGLDSNGRPYDITAGQVSRPCDKLTSRHIDLQGKSNVYLSFLYQETGRGESPSNIDSLRLEFWSPFDTVWTSVWGVVGTTGPFHNFKSVVIPITDSSYLQKGFRFRFTSFGNPSGAFDVWNVDYVVIRQWISSPDTLPEDIAFVYPHRSLLSSSYEAIPYWVYGNNPSNYTRSSVKQSYKRNNPQFSGTLGVSAYYLTGQGVNQSVGPDVNLNAVHRNLLYQIIEWDQPINKSFTNDLDPINQSFTLKMTSFLSGSGAGLRQNDTLVRNQFFGNYYAYDDGSAERAYGIANQAGAISLSSFSIQASDSLKGMYIYFQPADVDPRTNAFQIVVYENNAGIPGNVLFESDSLYVPRFSEHNQFIPFSLDKAFFMPSGTYFIGTKQRDAAKLNIGFDINNHSTTTLVYGDGSNWFPTIFDGTLMIRPYFRTEAPEISVDKHKKPSAWTVYPNPTSDVIRVKGSYEKLHYQIRDLLGRVVAEGTAGPSDDISLQHLPSGMYLMMDAETNVFRAKIRKQ
ncbi:MAG: T9SS type A sorting domain-containing protein [Cryomorphaceae bacterium]|nr:T9SS type A sorting domain-containing protein [Cryomorphaceae bacterium]